MRKCGYSHPKATRPAPARNHGHDADVTTTCFGSFAAARRSTTASSVNIVPLKGLPDIHVTAATEVTGSTHRNAAERSDTRGRMAAATSTTARPTCQQIASQRHAFATEVAHNRMLSADDITHLLQSERRVVVDEEKRVDRKSVV